MASCTERDRLLVLTVRADASPNTATHERCGFGRIGSARRPSRARCQRSRVAGVAISHEKVRISSSQSSRWASALDAKRASFSSEQAPRSEIGRAHV